MVRVAVCPKCSHESVMFDLADSEEWARCPECRTHFQLKNASARDIPPLVMTKDEALLADEESEAAKETVDSALETRWDTRRTFNGASTQAIAGIEPTTNVPAEDQIRSAEPPPESARDEAKRTISDLSALATWSDLPVDQSEAQARAEQAGDTPDDYPPPSETPTLRLRRSRDANDDDSRTEKSPQSSAGSTDRFNRWFQTETIFDFTPPTPDEAANDLADRPQPPNEVAPTSNLDEEGQSETESDATDNDESSSYDESSSGEESSSDNEPEPKVPNNEHGDAPPAMPSAWPQGRPVPHWARPSRRRSPLRTFIMIGFGGVFGLVLGYYALMWITGPRGDFLDAAQYLPSAILPREFRSPVVTVGDSDSIASDSIASQTIESPYVADDVEESVATEQAPPAVASGSAEREEAGEAAVIAGAPSFSADELAVTLQKAREAKAGLVTGNFEDSGEVKRTKGQSYMAFCDLARKATFVDRDSNASYASALEREVQDLVRTTLANTHAQEEVAHLVPLWINSTKRTHAGIFFAGRVTNQADKGTVIDCQVDFGGGEPLTVLVPQEQADAIESSARPLGVLGWLVDQPAENVHGYTGDAAQAVWAGHIISLE
jgi:hypothetical protein